LMKRLALVVLMAGLGWAEAAAANPTITSISPSTAIALGPQFTLTVNGTGFVSGSSNIVWNAPSGGLIAPLTTTYVNANRLTTTIPAGFLSTAGVASVSVSTLVGNSVVGTSSWSFLILNPAPTITGESPATPTAGHSFTVNGSNFVTGAVAYINGGELPGAVSTTVLNSNQLSVSISGNLCGPYAPGASPFTLNVVNPGPGGGSSSIVNLNITTAEGCSPATGGVPANCKPTFSNQSNVSFSNVAIGSEPFQVLAAFSDPAQYSDSWSATASSPGGWLSVSPSSAGTLASQLTVVANSASLSPGSTNTGTVTVVPQSSICHNAGVPLAISVTITVAQAAPILSVSVPSVSLTAVAGANPATSPSFQIQNQGAGVLIWTTLTSVSSGSGWLSVSPGSGTASSSVPATVNVNVTSASLAAGSYSGLITISSTTTGVQGSPQTVIVSLTVTPPPPFLSITPSSRIMNFSTIVGSNPSTQTFQVNNAGGGALSWTAVPSSAGNWISLSATSGAAPATVTVSVNALSFGATSTSGSIVVTAAGASNSPQTIQVNLTVSPPPSQPVLYVTPLSLNFNTTAGTSPASQSFQVQNTGTGSLSWSASVTSGNAWLSLFSFGNTAPSTVTVSVNPGTLPAGTYGGSISVSSAGAQSSPQTISVTLNVSQQVQPILSVTPVLLNFSATAGVNPANQSFQVQNTGNGSLTWSASITSGNSWLSVSPSAGTAPSSVTVSANSGTLLAGTYNGSISVTSATAGSQSIPVTLTIKSANTPAPDINSTYALTSTGTCASSFYEADATLNAGQQQGVYSMIVSINQGLLAGGFNLGGGFGASGTMPGFGQFQTSNLAAGAVNIQIQAQPLSGTAVNLIVTVLNASNNNSMVYMTSGPPPLNFNTPVLAQSTYYTVAVSSAAGSPSGTFQMSMATASGLGGFQGGVVAGGMAIAGVTGYGAFCLPISQPVSIKLQTGSTFGTAAAGVMTMTMKNKATGQVFPPSP